MCLWWANDELPCPRRLFLHAARRRHLCQLETSLAALAPRLIAGLAFQRWACSTEACQLEEGQRCYRALHLPRTLAAWRSHAASQARLRSLGQQLLASCTDQLARSVLMAWRHRTARRAAGEAAQATWRARIIRVVLLRWSGWAAARVLLREQIHEAAVAHARRLLAAMMCAWRRRARARRYAKGWWAARLRTAAFGCWLDRTRLKAAQAAAWRRAVRWRYLRSLTAGLDAFRRQVSQQQQAAERAAAAHSRALTLAALTAWHGPFLQASRACRAVRQLAHRFRRASLQAAALAAWQAYTAQRAAKHRQLSDLAQQLRPLRQRRALIIWRRACVLAQHRRWRALAAEQQARCRLLRVAWSTWRECCAQWRAKRAQWCAALLHSSRQVQARALARWRQAAMLRLAALGEEGTATEAEQQQDGEQEQDGGDEEVAVLLKRLRQLRQLACGAAEEQSQLGCSALLSSFGELLVPRQLPQPRRPLLTVLM